MSMIKTAMEVADLALKGATLDQQKLVLQFREEALAMEENFALKTRVQELEKALAIQQELDYDSGLYWRKKNGDKEAHSANGAMTQTKNFCVYNHGMSTVIFQSNVWSVNQFIQ